jgi:hypothetical protein
MPRASLTRCLVAAVLALAHLPVSAIAQPAAPRERLLSLVPPDVGVCLLVNDLRGHAEKWERAPWVQALRQTALFRALGELPEARQLAAFEGVLKQHLGIDWPTLRDDILGDAVVLAYRPGPPGQPELEQGMVALRARQPKRLAELVSRFNELQKAGGELQAVESLQHRGATYYRRVHVTKTHWYYLNGPLLIVAGNETMLRQAIDRDLDPLGASNPWPARFSRAGAAQAVVTLAVNPQSIDPFPRPGNGEKPHGVAGVWRGLDAIFLALAADSKLELRLALEGRGREMPPWAQPLFAQSHPSVLWQAFPEPAILTLAGRSDFANLAQGVLEMLPAGERSRLTDGLQAGLGLITQLDLFRDVLPSLGPDWGLCVLPPADGSALPQVIAALAVKPGNGPEPVDAMLFKGAQLFAGLAVLDYNRKNPADPIKVESVQQGKVTVKFLTHVKLFPAGFRPACAVKDGFLLLASSPEAVARFGPRETPPAAQGETPLLRVAPSELAQLLRLRRASVVDDLQQKHHLTAVEAERMLDRLLGLLNVFESVSVIQRGEPGQVSWALRLVPRSK